MNENENRDTILVAGDSMLHGLDEKRLSSKSKHRFKITVFPGAKTMDMYDYLNPLLRKTTYKAIVLHVDTNDARDSSSQEIVQKIMDIRKYIRERVSPETNIIISNPILRTDDGKARLTIT